MLNHVCLQVEPTGKATRKRMAKVVVRGHEVACSCQGEALPHAYICQKEMTNHMYPQRH